MARCPGRRLPRESSLVAADALAYLPHEAVIGRLGHLARAALSSTRPPSRRVYSLLAPPRTYAGHASYYCDGPVPLLRGMLARRLGFVERARGLLELSIRRSDRTRLALCAIASRLELADCLGELAPDDSVTRVRELAREAHGLAAQHGYEAAVQRARSLAMSAGGRDPLSAAWSPTAARDEPRPSEA